MKKLTYLVLGLLAAVLVAAAADSDPVWSPDGKIIFRSQRDENAELYQVNPRMTH